MKIETNMAETAPSLTYETMTSGQLKLEFAAKCRQHGANEVRALGLAVYIDDNFLRDSLICYRDARARGDEITAENALISVVEKALAR